VLEHIAATTGAAVLYLHHVNKGSARDGQTDQQQAARALPLLTWCRYRTAAPVVAAMCSNTETRWAMSPLLF
ncbi:hypothetical protein, partial [Aeromonas caviae]|uniref:hypothetical protein n=1 Tax=Aeromonas caviae TaxID=648 RepID=UPI00403A0188